MRDKDALHSVRCAAISLEVARNVRLFMILSGQWTFLWSALATVDRPIFGWVGRFFWHGIAHDHVAHHSSSVYHSPTLYALWRSFMQCKFVESTGDTVFFKNMHGKVVRECSVADARPAKEAGVAGHAKSAAEAGFEGEQDEKEDVMAD
ncbi:uncharacterized protein B0H18DRAFT_1125003 [Fomitopsis serialis]|uniref:uncharacterized protein n=1 Tax=Fomitopsis serialis TaxID=139415 RepID=UPI0020077425|nr:uncharacterized protein B0H18DRAFT_1125003 [Neoantrodia serialis]KAH9915200.1 hypothetical protein B0H18DRAFT_1125003 [Neoantrodia serialis]